MAHVSLESKLNFGLREPRHISIRNLYKVVINGEEGESFEFEVEADSFAEASSQGEDLAAGLVDIQYIEVYQID